MLSWAIGFLIVAIIAAIFGFGGIAAGAAGIAKILFFLFLIAFAVSLVMHLMSRSGPGPPVSAGGKSLMAAAAGAAAV